MDLIEIFTTYYMEKDFLHDINHIQRIKKKIDEISKPSSFNEDILNLACFFHGLSSLSDHLKSELIRYGYNEEVIVKSFETSYLAKKNSPESNESKILHDAHLLEGGDTFFTIKCLISGTLMGQNLNETLNQMNQKYFMMLIY